jgi:hypothetical protein
MMKTKSILMLVVLSAGLLTVLTGTALSQVQSVFADNDEECEENDDNNCNEEIQKVHQENNCKIVNEGKNDDKSDGNSNGGNENGDLTCITVAQNPKNGDATIVINLFPPIPLDPFALVLPF